MKEREKNQVSKQLRCIVFPWLHIGILAVILSIGSLVISCSKQVSDGEISIFVAGDALITRPWSQFDEPEFLRLIDEIRNADAAVLNLEMLIHTFKGFPERYNGQGTPMSAEPVIAQELAWAGFDMVGNANNHTNDYGVIGVLETKEFVEGAGIGYAGAGEDLQRASKPVYYETPEGTVALLSTASSFTSWGAASRSRPDVHGRPGLNPLATTSQTVTTVTRAAAEKLERVAREEGISGVSISQVSSGERLRFLGQNYSIGGENGTSRTTTIDPDDLQRNLAAIREAKVNAKYAVLSIHTHQSGSRQGDVPMPPDFLIEFAHASIDNGLDVFFSHGPHYLKGIEIYKGKPIFYSLGNFLFQSETVKKLPAEYFARQSGYDDNSTAEEFQKNTRDSWNRNRRYWESIVATVHFKEGKLDQIRLIPITLGAGPPGTEGVALPFGVRGRPVLADAELGKYIIDQIAERSAVFGTEIEYVESENIGIIKIQ